MELPMVGEKDVQRRLEIIERSIAALDATADPSLRATVQQLVESIVELHGRGLERLLEVIHGSGIAGPPIIDQLGRDPLVSSLLLLHSLHPLTLEERVLKALEAVRPTLRAKQSEVELISIVDAAVRVRLLGGPEQKAALQSAILDAAPDVSALEVEGAVDAVVGFVSFASLRGADRQRLATPPAPTPVHTLGA
jgi:hypothetical protein